MLLICPQNQNFTNSAYKHIKCSIPVFQFHLFVSVLDAQELMLLAIYSPSVCKDLAFEQPLLSGLNFFTWKINNS